MNQWSETIHMVCFVSVSSDSGSMLGGGARGQNLGHIKNNSYQD